jgi:hypothetical protein
MKSADNAFSAEGKADDPRVPDGFDAYRSGYGAASPMAV